MQYIKAKDVYNIERNALLQPHKLHADDMSSVEEHIRLAATDQGWNDYFGFAKHTEFSGKGFCLGIHNMTSSVTIATN